MPMNIKLIRLPTFFAGWDTNSSEMNCSLLPPVGLALIKGYLGRKGFRISQDDLNIKIFYEKRYKNKDFNQGAFFDEERILRYCRDNAQDEEIEEIFRQTEKICPVKKFDVILFSIQESLRNKSNVFFAIAFARYLKKKYNPFIMLGGFGVAVKLAYLEYDFGAIDFFSVGSGEGVLESVLNAKRQNLSLLGLDKVYYQHDNRLVSADYFNIEEPDFRGLPINYYKYRGLHDDYASDVRDIIKEFHRSKTLILPFGFIKGCPYQCIFCSESRGSLEFMMEPRKVVEILSRLQRKYSPAGFFFLNNEINITENYIEELCDLIISRKLKILWSDCARANFSSKSILEKMKRAGCIRLIFGIETGSDRLLGYIKKGVVIEGLEQVLRWAHELGIWTGIEIICGLPHEHKEDVEATVNFLQRNRKYINRFYYNTFDLRQGSLLYHEPSAYGICNIFNVNEVVPFEERKYSKNFTQFGFDEVGGLAWEKKKKQVLDSYDRVVEAMGGYEGFPTYEEEHFLFFLYRKFGHDIDKVQAIFRRVSHEKGSYRDYLRKAGLGQNEQ